MKTRQKCLPIFHICNISMIFNFPDFENSRKGYTVVMYLVCQPKKLAGFISQN